MLLLLPFFFFQLEERERQFDEERNFKVCINFIN